MTMGNVIASLRQQAWQSTLLSFRAAGEASVFILCLFVFFVFYHRAEILRLRLTMTTEGRFDFILHQQIAEIVTSLRSSQ
jgi:hypothetical protein